MTCIAYTSCTISLKPCCLWLMDQHISIPWELVRDVKTWVSPQTSWVCILTRSEVMPGTLTFEKLCTRTYHQVACAL